MDDLLWNGTWTNNEDDTNEESLFVSDYPSRCLSPPLQELQTFAGILGLPEIETPAPEMRAVEFGVEPKSWPSGGSSSEVLLEEFENDKGIAPKGEFWGMTFEKKKPKQNNPITEKQPNSANNNNHHFQHPTIFSSPSQSSSNNNEAELIDRNHVGSQMKELMYLAAVFRPVNFGPETVEKKWRRNVKTSKEPQTIAARKRREKISEKIRALQRLVPGGSKMDTASMLDEAASYLKFLRAQIKALEGTCYKHGSIDYCLSNCTSFNSTPFPLNAYFFL